MTSPTNITAMKKYLSGQVSINLCGTKDATNYLERVINKIKPQNRKAVQMFFFLFSFSIRFYFNMENSKQ